MAVYTTGFFFFILLMFTNSPIFTQIKYPETRKTSQEDNYFGTNVADPYRWLENDNSDETKEWVTLENKVTHKYLCQLFEGREVQKFYRAIVHGSPAQKKGTINAPIAEHTAVKGMMVVHRNGKESITDYEVIDAHSAYLH